MNEIWRQQRKIVSQELAPRTIRRYHAFQEAEAQALVKGIVNDSSDLEGLLKL
jgi:cytochrome P450